MKASIAKEGSKREWVTVTGHEGIPEYNAISDPHCPVARTPAVLKLCEQHAAPMPQRKMKASNSGSPHHTHTHGGHMCSRQKRAMDFMAKQKRFSDTDGGANAQQQQRPKKRLIKRWNLSTMDEQSDEEDIHGNPIERKAASPPRRNFQIEQALENWSTIRDDINGCWAFYGINAGYIDKRRDDDRRLYEGVQKLYDREDEERQMEATIRDRNEKRTRFAKYARERQAKEEGVQPGSTASSRQRSVCGPLSPRGSRQVEPKAPAQPPKGNPRNSSVGGTGASSSTVSPTTPYPPIPKPPAKQRQHFQPQYKENDNDGAVPLAESESLFCTPSVSPVKVTTSTTTTTTTTTTQQNQPSQQNGGAQTSSKRGGSGVVIPLEDNSPERVRSSQQQQQQQQPPATTQHINDVIMEGMNNSSHGYNAEEEL